MMHHTRHTHTTHHTLGPKLTSRRTGLEPPDLEPEPEGAEPEPEGDEPPEPDCRSDIETR